MKISDVDSTKLKLKSLMRDPAHIASMTPHTPISVARSSRPDSAAHEKPLAARFAGRNPPQARSLAV